MAKKFLFFLITVVMMGIVAEGLLRLTGLALQRPQSVDNSIEPQDKNRLRILTIGESTTADFYAEDIAGTSTSWPRQLNAILKSAGVDARVYNEGVPGVSSLYFERKLPELLAIYHPHIVISMIGINDPLLKAGQIRGAGWFESLHIVRVAKWAVDRIKTRFQPFKPRQRLTEEFWKIRHQAIELPPTQWRTKIPTMLGPLPFHWRAFIFAEVAIRCHGFYTADPSLSLSLCRDYAERAYSLQPQDPEVIMSLIYIAESMKDSRRIEQLANDIVREQVEVNDEILTRLMYYSPKEYPSVWQMLETHGIQPGSDFNPITSMRERFQKIDSMIRESGARHYKMQYPTLPVGRLAESYNVSPQEDLDRIGFIENRNNFVEALKEHPYSYVFLDKFERNWGHASVFGDSLIAKQAFDKLMRDGLPKTD